MSEYPEEIETLMPESFPEPWACEWGQDEIGLWNTLMYKNVKQVFRWILPNKFMMGSLESEPERYADEKLHEVIISRGFWLGDTVCTQALWKAVMGDNPSEFKGEERPVEMVSWDDVQGFLEKFNQDIKEVEFRLPTEAEWEYACRAGTTTPFSFGDNINTQHVNYDGNYPYNNAETGKYREATVPVKSMPMNSWKLYEMHGNVYEWCSDWYQENYDQDNRVDPQGPESGVYRVVRGGSWYCNGGRYVRSAYRYWSAPVNRVNYTGFRLALGHSSSGRGSA